MTTRRKTRLATVGGLAAASTFAAGAWLSTSAASALPFVSTNAAHTSVSEAGEALKQVAQK
jgi:hypothetical protein